MTDKTQVKAIKQLFPAAPGYRVVQGQVHPIDGHFCHEELPVIGWALVTLTTHADELQQGMEPDYDDVQIMVYDGEGGPNVLLHANRPTNVHTVIVPPGEEPDLVELETETRAKYEEESGSDQIPRRTALRN
jgi:hypothetical protein